MNTHVAAWQLDMFDESSPVHILIPKPDPLPDPHLWSESVRDKMVDALISRARDSRRGDKMPESLMDCAYLISDRLRNKKIDATDYGATLGWIMGYWDGAVPYVHVCEVSGTKVRFLRDFILDTPLLACDLRELQRAVFGSLL
ncbi:hypothetical protein [Paraburkholderia sp. GAS334]|uniref:hypothetical protein n=1 Tax=Paraburkholderia sp. GAS334 TaxID=3035131 RepID=UPI003D22DA0D